MKKCLMYKRLWLLWLMLWSLCLWWLTYAQDWIKPVLWNRISVWIWEWFSTQWFWLTIQWQLQKKEVEIPKNQLDLTVDNDIIYNINKKYFQEKQNKKKQFEKQIEDLISKVEKKEQSIDWVTTNYRKYIEIEDTINKADFIRVLALPIDKFLFVEDNDWTQKIIVTRKPIIKDIAWKNDKDLEKIIENEINDIITTTNYQEMVEKIRYYQNKFDRDYSSLFVEKTLDQFYNDLKINISYKDKLFIQNYTYKNKKYMNSLEYLPRKLKWLEQYTNDYYLIYIPLYLNENVSNILKWLDRKETIFKNSSEFCYMISYNDNYQQFEDYFCWLDDSFNWNQVRVKQITMNNNNNYYITLSRRWFLTVLYELWFMILCWIIPFFLIKRVDKIIDFWNKFETENI